MAKIYSFERGEESVVHTDERYTISPFFSSYCVIYYSLALLPLFISKQLLDTLELTMFLLPRQTTN